MKKLFRKFLNYIFRDILWELRKINQNLTIIRLMLLADEKEERKEVMDALGPLRPLGEKPSIFEGD